MLADWTRSKWNRSPSFQKLAILRRSREFSPTSLARGRWREMRSEKEQMTAGKEKGTVELQFREVPGEQELGAGGSAKHKDEKKEVFSKVRRSRGRGEAEGGRRVAVLTINMEEPCREAGSLQHRGQRPPRSGTTGDGCLSNTFSPGLR